MTKDDAQDRLWDIGQGHKLRPQNQSEDRPQLTPVGEENGEIEGTSQGMTSSFQFGSRQGSTTGSQSGTQKSTATSGAVATPYSTRDIGAMLRERREALGVTLAETEAATRIRQKYLAALESDEWHLLPGEVVGRGFLRNYAAYLGLEPTEVIARRRAVTGDSVTMVLANTSAGSSLPPVRQVDYRPKDVELLDEGEGMERREVRFGPILSVLAAIILLIGIWFARDALTRLAAGTADVASAAFDNVRSISARPTEAVDLPTPAVGIVNPVNEGIVGVAAPAVSSDGATGSVDAESVPPTADPNAGLVLIPTATPTLGPPTPTVAVEPTVTPTETPIPLPTATPIVAAEVEVVEPPQEEVVQPVEDAALLLPTPTLEPEPVEAVVAAPICPDPRSVITSPGVNQTVGGVIGIAGSATHETFQYYKLEYAPGANATGGFVYFDGGNNQVVDGLLGGLDTTILPNGLYTVHLIVVDETGNFPAPCSVTIDLQN